MVFPLMLIVMVFIRMGMSRLFTPVELRALDDPLPSLREIFATKKSRNPCQSPLLCGHDCIHLSLGQEALREHYARLAGQNGSKNGQDEDGSLLNDDDEEADEPITEKTAL